MKDTSIVGVSYPRRKIIANLTIAHHLQSLGVEPTNMMATNNSIIPLLISSFLFLLLPTVCFSWQVGRTQDTSNSNIRRSIITTSPFIAINSLSITIANAESNTIPNLQFTTSSSGLQYADVKKGSGSSSPTDGQNVSIDYVMSTTGARYGRKVRVLYCFIMYLHMCVQCEALLIWLLHLAFFSLYLTAFTPYALT